VAAAILAAPCAAGFRVSTGGLAVLAAASFAGRAGFATRAGARLAAGRVGRARRVVALLRTCLGDLLGAFLAAFARVFVWLVAVRAGLAGARFLLVFFPAVGRAAARGELRFGRLVRLPVGRFLAITV